MMIPLAMKTKVPSPPQRFGKRKVLIVDDHAILREGLSRVISEEADLVVCGAVASPQQALQALATLKPDIAIVDVTLEHANGLELIKDIKIRHPRLPILVLSMHDESLYADRCLRAGAKGYIMKHEPAQTLLRAIRQVLAGEIYVSETVSRAMVQTVAANPVGKSVPPLQQLSDRELEVIRLLGLGYRPRAVAAELHLSVKTVEYHCEHIKRKLRLKTADQLVQQAIQFAHAEFMTVCPITKGLCPKWQGIEFSRLHRSRLPAAA
jgi:DNA-binding NarL/FixJ family response regulator